MLNVIEEKIKTTVIILRQMGYRIEQISAREFHDYMTGETPTGDTITIDDVLENEFLLVHELVEMSELKKMNIPIHERTVMDFYPSVYKAHFVAFDYELTCAIKIGDYKWFKKRFISPASFLSNLNDPYLPPSFEYLREEVEPICKAIIEKFSAYL